MEPNTTTENDRRPAPLGRGGRVWRAVSPYLYSMVAALALLGLTEVVLRTFWPQDARLAAVDRWTSREVTWGVLDPVIGHRLRPNTASVERAPEFTVRYLTDGQGFRADPDAAASVPASAAPASGTRVMVIGDSFAFGSASKWPETWANRLQGYLADSGTPVQIFNTGTPGYDTRAETLLLEETIARFRPSVVVMMFLPNDLITNLPIARSEGARHEMEGRVQEIGSAKASSLHSVVLAQRVATSVDRVYCALYLMTPRKEYYALPQSAHVRGQVKTTQELLVRAKDVAARNGARLVVVSVPQLFQVLHVANGYALEGVDSRWIDREFARHARANGYQWVPMLDHLAARYRGGDDDLYYRYDGHLTPRGNDVVARFLAQNDGWIAAPARARPALAARDAHPAPRGSMESF